MQDSLQKRQAAQLPAGPLNDSNAAVVQILTDLVQRATALQGLISAGPTANEAPLIVEEWKKIKARMPDAGLTPQEQARTADTESGIQATARATGGGGEAPAQPSPSETATPAASQDDINKLASPITNLSGMTFSYALGVSAVFNHQGHTFQGGCTIGTGGITSDAAIWDVTVTLLAKTVPDMARTNQFVQTDKAGLALVPFITVDPNTELLITGRKAYIGRTEQNLIVPKFHFRNLSLNEVTDLLQSLKNSNVKIQESFSAALPKVTVFQILAPVSAKDHVSSYFNAVQEKLLGTGPIDHATLLKQMTANAGKDLTVNVDGVDTTVHIEQPVTVTYSTPSLTGDTADDLAKFAADLANVGAHGKLDLTKDKGQRLISSKGDADTDTGKPLVIENECFQLSFAPGIQNGGLAPAANFRGRISYLPDNLPLTLKLSAEGETASDPAKPRRVAGNGDFTYLSKPFLGGWYVTLGATGDSSYAQMAGIGVTEWRGGGKFELQTPTQKFFPARGGNDQKPTLTIEAGGVGGSIPNTSTNFIVRGDFVYTLQPDAKIFLDFRAAAAHSQDGRFAGRNDFSFGGFTGRYTIYNDWDFIAKYECGRKDPLYVKSCGWQTGFGIKTK
jgi:hypothetical protein